jgi:hypothetical protein
MLMRRTFFSGLLGLGMVAGAWAQRPARPIARPPRLRPDGSVLFGRFGEGVASGPLPGVFVVVAVNAQDDTVQLRGEDNRTGVVHVKPDIFDLDTVKPGDEVEVDFLVPQPGVTVLEAGNIWPVQR